MVCQPFCFLEVVRTVDFILLIPDLVAKFLPPRMLASQAGTYFCFIAIAEISIRALLTKAAACMVARAGLGSGITLL